MDSSYHDRYENNNNSYFFKVNFEAVLSLLCEPLLSARKKLTSNFAICDPSRQKGHVVGKHCFEI